MTLYVVDSSVAIKWYVPEVNDVEALRLRNSGAELHAPDFVQLEAAAILWKKIRKQEITRSDADDVLLDFCGIAELRKHPFEQLILLAFDLAERTGRTVYDCLYLALAVQLDCVMVTADVSWRMPSPEPCGPSTFSNFQTFPDSIRSFLSAS